MDNVTLWQGDCLELMGQIPDGSVDLILCDLPYGTTECEWDSVIPLEPLWAHYKRVTKPNAAIVLTASQPFTTALIASNMAWFRYEWIWEKNNSTGQMNAKKMPLKRHENVLVFYAELPTYNPQGLTPCTIKKTCARTDFLGERPNSRPIGMKYTQEFKGYPDSILRYDIERGLHETQKPVALMEYLVRTYSNPGETVLDNTMGSGSTGVAALRIGRRFIGIEKDADNFATAERRITGKEAERVGAASAHKQARLFDLMAEGTVNP